MLGFLVNFDQVCLKFFEDLNIMGEISILVVFLLFIVNLYFFDGGCV